MLLSISINDMPEYADLISRFHEINGKTKMYNELGGFIPREKAEEIRSILLREQTTVKTLLHHFENKHEVHGND